MPINQVYSLVNKPYLEVLNSVDNQFIRQLAHLSAESAKNMKIVSFVIKDNVNNRGEIAKKGVAASEKSVIDMCKLTPLVGTTGAKTLLEEVAMYRASTLNFPDVGPTFARDNAEMLMIDYLLAASLCYVEVFDGDNRVDKYFATRNRFIAGNLTNTPPEETAKYTSYLQSYSVNYQSKQLKVLKMNVNKTGFKVVQPRSFLDFNKSIKVTPVFLMTSFVEGVSTILQDRIIKFKYIKDNMTEREFVTTISPSILAKYYENDMVQKMITGIGVQLNRGYVKLPELGISKYDFSGVRALNISRITSLEVVDAVDASYIDVDFDTILPAFKETIFALQDVNILSLVHEDLTNQPVTAKSVPELQNILISYVDGQYAIGTTTALRYLHNYMMSRQQIFKIYHGGKRLSFGSIQSGFNLGVIE